MTPTTLLSRQIDKSIIKVTFFHSEIHNFWNSIILFFKIVILMNELSICLKSNL